MAPKFLSNVKFLRKKIVPKLVSIILLNWNGREVLEQCLKSIYSYITYPKYEIILVDQGSTDGSIEMVRKKFPKVKLIRNKKNVGISKGTNQAFKIARGEYLFLMANDIIASKGWLESCIELMEKDPKICSVGSVMYRIDKFQELQKNGKLERLKNILPVKFQNAVCSNSMSMKRKVLERIGLYDEESFTPYGSEETDWHWRAVNIGYKIVLNGRSIVGHFEAHDAKQLPTKGYLLVQTNWVKAALYNNSPFMFLTKSLPYLIFLFVGSIKHLITDRDPTRVILDLKSYWSNLKNIRAIMEQRRIRTGITKRLIKEQKIVGDGWW